MKILFNKKKAAAAAVMCIAACTAFTVNANKHAVLTTKTTAHAIDISENEPVPLAEVPTGGSAPVSKGLMPVALGTTVYDNGKAAIDASNTKKGYIMVAFTQNTTKKLKVIVTGPSGVKYTYNLTPSTGSTPNYEVFPLSDGNGKYTIGVYENIDGIKYATAFSQNIDVSLENEFAPFLLPNQYVYYRENSDAVKKAEELTKNENTDLEKITSVYNYVISNISYDKAKAASVASGYLPNIDAILISKKGICFDYAAVMTAMLRSQGIPCKLVVGYAGTAYHAWISAYTKENGWVDNIIMFDGKSWQLMDPTFASSGGNSTAIQEYIGDGKNYSAKYLY